MDHASVTWRILSRARQQTCRRVSSERGLNVVRSVHSCRCRVRLAQMDGSFEETDHPGSGMNGQWVRGGSLARRNVGGDFADELELTLACFRQQHGKQILEGDDANLQLHELGVRERRRFRRRQCGHREGQTAFAGAPFVVPPRKRLRPQATTFGAIGLLSRRGDSGHGAMMNQEGKVIVGSPVAGATACMSPERTILVPMNERMCCAGVGPAQAGSGKAKRPASRPAPAASSACLADGNENQCKVLTVGHSTRSIDAFLELLRSHCVTQLIDVRTVPRSRHNPQFNQDSLPASLAAAGIGYDHAPGLGGFRPTATSSLNSGWRNLSFRGYADYMQTPDFVESLASVIELSLTDRVALMCAEAVPWRCHRSLIADALVVNGVRTCEIVSAKRLQPHKLALWLWHITG